MVFNDLTNHQGLCQDARFLLGLSVSDTVSYNVKDLTRNINSWYRKANQWIWEATGTWEYDDSNYTNLPIATTDLVDGQDNYELPTIAQRLDRIEVMNAEGDYVKLTPIDKSQIDVAMSEFADEDGMPEYYDVIGRSIILYPTPDTTKVTLSNGLKAYFSRGVNEFAITDTSTEPGFDDNFHRLLSVGAAYDWAISKDIDNTSRINSLSNQILTFKEEIQKFYGSRDRGMKARIIPKTESNI